VLFIHNGSDYTAHLKHLTDAGLLVTETHPDSALTQALRLQPDIIVLDFGFNGELTTQFKGHSLTRHIPVIALAELTRPQH
jgi:CheY-like chemotaxis protein